MGTVTSQEIDRFISNNVNTVAVAQVISNYATRTNAISNNVQDVSISVTGSTIDGPINVSQEIENFIDVEQLIDRANIAELTNDLQQVVSTELRDAIIRTTDGVEFLSTPGNQLLRDRVLSQVDNYTRQVVNTNRIDELLLSASNYQRGSLTVDQSTVSGPIVFNQRIQSNIMANNIVRDVVQVAIQNQDVQQLYTRADATLNTVNVSPLSQAGGITTWIFYIGAALVLIAGILIAFIIPATPKVKIVVAVIAIVIALILLVIGLVRANTMRTPVPTMVGKKKQ